MDQIWYVTFCGVRNSETEKFMTHILMGDNFAGKSVKLMYFFLKSKKSSSPLMSIDQTNFWNTNDDQEKV